MPAIQKITTFLWFDNNAEEAVHFYVSVFKNSKLSKERSWAPPSNSRASNSLP